MLSALVIRGCANECSPTIGTLVAMSPEELVIKPIELEKPATVDVRIHFPRVGFVARPYKEEAKL